METAFGSEYVNFQLKDGKLTGKPSNSITNAYRLVYIKESELQWFGKDAPISLIPKPLQELFDSEQK